MRWLLMTIVYVVVTCNIAAGQISQGGRPLDVPVLKSRGIPVAVMPAVVNKELQLKYNQPAADEMKLKPFRFAHGFEVNINPEKDGLWVKNIDGFDVWLIKITSAGALSLNLIFDDFFLPEGARLFLFNEKNGHLLGAFTSANNKDSGKFAVSPVAGDELTVQYEVPSGNTSGSFIISEVNHDFIGLFDDRRPLGIIAGSCNVDVNCSATSSWHDSKDAVCRIIVSGREICSGVLVNNTAENKRPYILSAAHCYDRPEHAATSVFTFNYESPYCAPLDGDPSNSVSGAVMKASSDSLDFALVELSLVPPPEFRPYYSGWDRSGNIPDSTKSIHHPQGDIKKISTDLNPPVVSNFSNSKQYTRMGFLKVLRWEAGVTEAGSSGGPLFNPSGKVIGTLTGGNATCYVPETDLFSRFDMAWEYRPDSSRQLKHWLDPLKSNKLTFGGKRFYEGEDLCLPYTNLEDFDEHQNVVLSEGGVNAGYWGGTNKVNITEFAERFSIPGNEQLQGVSIGVGFIRLSVPSSTSEITVKVYNGKDSPGAVLHSQRVLIKNLAANAMNFIGFDKIIEPGDTFFVGFELTKIQPVEQFVVYQSLRQQGKTNFFWFRQNNSWYDFQAANSEGHGMANVFELVACNVDDFSPERPLVNEPMESIIYPNPAQGIFTFEAGQEIIPEDIRIYNLIGQEVKARFNKVQGKKVQIDLSGNMPGIYFIRFNSILGKLSEKVIYSPW